MKPPECEGCPCESFPGPVFGGGPDDALLAAAGEAPAANEIDLGTPFVGGAGRVLNALLGQAGIGRSDVWISNALCCRIPGDDLSKFDQAREAIIHCKTMFLEPRLRKHSAKVVLAMGNAANFALTERGEPAEGIYTHRGFPFEGITVPQIVLPTIHPAALMYDRKMWQVVVTDIRKAVRLAKEGWHRPPENFVIAQSPDDVEGFANLAIENNLTLSVDIENPGGPLWMIGFGTIEGYAIAIPFLRTASDRWWTEKDELKVIEQVQRLLTSDLRKIVHFEQHERFWLTQYGFELRGEVWDTHSMHAMLYPPLPHDLGFTVSVHTDRVSWKHLAPDWSKASEEVDK